MKRPIVVEFSGLPNSGKTTLLSNIDKLCKDNNVKAIIMQEPAELLPKTIQKGSIEQNLWITLETLQKSLEINNLSDVDFILLDRGFYNQLFWATMYDNKDSEYSKFITSFMRTFAEKYDVLPDYLYIIDVEVEESIKRRISSGEPVTFTKKDFLINYKRKFEEFAEKIESKFYLDTTNLRIDQVAEIVFNKIITL
jgi:thymidylate kinase